MLDAPIEIPKTCIQMIVSATGLHGTTADRNSTCNVVSLTNDNIK